MNPETNRFESLSEEDDEILESLVQKDQHQIHEDGTTEKSTTSILLRPDGTPVPAHWSVYQVGETVVVKNYCFKVVYIGESTLLLEPMGPVLVGKGGT